MRRTSRPSILTTGPCGPTITLKERLRPRPSSLASSSLIFSIMAGLLVALWPESQVSEHPEVVPGVPAWRCKIVAYHHAVGPGSEDKRLQVAQVHMPAPADYYVLCRQHEAGQRYYREAFDRREVVRAFQRRARPRVEEVDGYGIDIELAEGGKELYSYVPALSEAEDAAGAHMKAERLGGLHYIDIVFVVVCCADLWEEAPPGLQVVVIALEAAVL